LAIFSVTSVLSGAARADPMLMVVPVVMAAFGFVLMRKLTWDLADTVDDFGSYLIVRRGGKEARVELRNVMNVSISTMMNPPRITLTLVESSELGKEISFSPKRPMSLNPFAKNPIGQALIERVYYARRENAL
jgi:hypothetical protein